MKDVNDFQDNDWKRYANTIDKNVAGMRITDNLPKASLQVFG